MAKNKFVNPREETIKRQAAFARAEADRKYAEMMAKNPGNNRASTRGTGYNRPIFGTRHG